MYMYVYIYYLLKRIFVEKKIKVQYLTKVVLFLKKKPRLILRCKNLERGLPNSFRISGVYKATLNLKNRASLLNMGTVFVCPRKYCKVPEMQFFQPNIVYVYI